MPGSMLIWVSANPTQHWSCAQHALWLLFAASIAGLCRCNTYSLWIAAIEFVTHDGKKSITDDPFHILVLALQWISNGSISSRKRFRLCMTLIIGPVLCLCSLLPVSLIKCILCIHQRAQTKRNAHTKLTQYPSKSSALLAIWRTTTLLPDLSLSKITRWI